jgi:hypothetical protein
MKKILTALLAVSMALAFVSAAAAVDFAGGDGSPGSRYEIVRFSIFFTRNFV